MYGRGASAKLPQLVAVCHSVLVALASELVSYAADRLCLLKCMLRQIPITVI